MLRRGLRVALGAAHGALQVEIGQQPECVGHAGVVQGPRATRVAGGQTKQARYLLRVRSQTLQHSPHLRMR